MAANATIVVQFNTAGGAGSGAHLSAEVDSRPNGLNAGKTSFAPGDSVGILIFQRKVINLALESSSGSVNLGGGIIVERTQDLTFANAETATLQVPALNIVSHKWLGRSLGFPLLEQDGSTVRVSKGVGVCRITYRASATTCTLFSPVSLEGVTNFSVLVVISGDEDVG